MKNRMNAVSLAIIILFSSFTSFGQVKEEREVGSFSGIGISISGDIYLTQGSPASVTVESDPETLDILVTEVKNDVLKIRYQTNVRGKKNVRVWITTPDIEEIAMAGSGVLIAQSDIKSDEIELAVSGSGKIILKGLTADEVSTAISGSGTVSVAGGFAKEMDIAVSGSGNIDAAGFQVEECSVAISGSGSCRIYVSEELSAGISGSGSVFYGGKPQVEAKVSGSGKIRSAD